MISLALLSTLLLLPGQGESLFPPPALPREIPGFSDKNLFRYLAPASLGPISAGNEPKWDDLKVAPLKADAQKLRVLLLVAERDFSNPDFCNIMEMNDKQRLMLAMRRLPSLAQSLSGGQINLEVIPRFIAEPIFDVSELRFLMASEFNQAAFDSDDQEERGPFDAILAVSSSDLAVGDPIIKSFASLDGPSSGLNLELNLAQEVVRQVGNRIREMVPGLEQAPGASGLSLFGGGASVSGASVLERPAGAALDGLTARLSSIEPRMSFSPSPLSGPVSVKVDAGVMTYTESSLLRAGSIALPSLPKGSAKTFTFKVRTKSLNSLAVSFMTPGADRRPGAQISFGARGQIRIAPDGTWQTVSAVLPSGAVNPFIGVPRDVEGRTRAPHEVIQYEFKEFELSNAEAPAAPTAPTGFPSTLEAVGLALGSEDIALRRHALARIEANPRVYISLREKLLTIANEVDGFLAYHAVKAYGLVSEKDLAFQGALNRLISTPASEYAREAALEVLSQNPTLTTFEAVAPNSVRRSWRTRIAALRCLAALDKTDLKAKPAARQLLLAACNQDMAIVRHAALVALKPEVDEERKQLEYSLVNDPSETLRILCLRMLAKAGADKTLLFGPLADDSWYVRSQVAGQLPESFRREALQRMVIDRDPLVRAAALTSFAQLEGETQAGEIQNTFVDTHPKIQFALAKGAQLGKWKLPKPVIDQLKLSQSPSARKLAESL